MGGRSERGRARRALTKRVFLNNTNLQNILFFKCPILSYSTMTIIKPLYFCLHRVSPFPPWLSGLPVISKRSRSIKIVKHNCHIPFTCFMQYQKLLQFPDISYSCSLHKRHLIASPSLNTQLFSNELSQSQGNLYEGHKYINNSSDQLTALRVVLQMMAEFTY